MARRLVMCRPPGRRVKHCPAAKRLRIALAVVIYAEADVPAVAVSRYCGFLNYQSVTRHAAKAGVPLRGRSGGQANKGRTVGAP